MSEFREEDHPRDEDGKFTAGEGGKRDSPSTSKNNKTAATQTTDFSSVTKREWAQWYHAIGEIKRGMWYPVVSNCHIVQIGNKVFFTGGTYEKPKLKKVLEFKSKELAHDFMERIMRNG